MDIVGVNINTTHSLVGRKVFFTLSKEAMKNSPIMDLTSDKQYEVIGMSPAGNFVIKDDAGDILLVTPDINEYGESDTSGHLANLAGWKLV